MVNVQRRSLQKSAWKAGANHSLARVPKPSAFLWGGENFQKHCGTVAATHKLDIALPFVVRINSLRSNLFNSRSHGLRPEIPVRTQSRNQLIPNVVVPSIPPISSTWWEYQN